MSAVSKQYETIMNEIDTLKIEENITDIDIQKQLLQFTNQFKSASNFMKNAANLIIDGQITLLQPMKLLKKQNKL